MTAEAKRLYDRKYSENPRYRLDKNTRSFLRAIILGRVKNSKYEILLGWQIKDFIQHIEKGFLPNMSWDNYGKWEIDHKRSLCTFIYSGESCPEYKQAWQLENLRPLWAYHNRKRKKQKPGSLIQI